MSGGGAASYVPTVVVSGAGVAVAVYYTYKYFQNKNRQTGNAWERYSSTSESFYTAQEYENDDDDEFCDAIENRQDIAEEDLLYDKVDKLMEGDECGIERAYLEMQKYFEDMSEEPNFLWRYAKVHHLMATVHDLKGKDKMCEELIEKGLKYAEEAVSKATENPEAHKWFAVLTGRTAELIKNKFTQAEKAKIFFAHIQQALKLKPKDWELHHLLGVFEYKLASLGSFQKPFALRLFKDISKCDYTVARSRFQEAEMYNPKPSKQTKLFLAKCLYGEKNFKEALKCLNEAIDIKVMSLHDEACHKEAIGLVSDYMGKV